MNLLKVNPISCEYTCILPRISVYIVVTAATAALEDTSGLT